MKNLLKQRLTESVLKTIFSVKRPGLLFIICLALILAAPVRKTAAEYNMTTVTDGLGRQVTIKTEVRRIATNYGIAAHMVFVLGKWDRLVGIDLNSRTNLFFNTLYPDIAKMPSVGTVGEINVEAMLAARPDLILIPGKNRQVADYLASLGLPVFGVVAEDLDELSHTVQNLGKALNAENRAAQFMDLYSRTLAKIENRLSGLPGKDRPRVYLAGPMGFLSTCAKDMYQYHLIERCSGRNAAELSAGIGKRKGWTEVSGELILKWNPDIILVVHYSSTTPAQIMADPRWQGINAVKHKKVYFFPSRLNPWDYPSPQAVLGLQWLAALLHPDRFKDVDSLSQANAFYEVFYGKSFEQMGGTIPEW